MKTRSYFSMRAIGLFLGLGMIGAGVAQAFPADLFPNVDMEYAANWVARPDTACSQVVQALTGDKSLTAKLDTAAFTKHYDEEAQKYPNKLGSDNTKRDNNSPSVYCVDSACSLATN